MKSRTSSIINVAGLTLGLTGILFILVWVRDERSYEKFFKNAGQICRIVETQYYDGAPFPVAVTPVPLAQELKSKYPEILKASLCSKWWPVIKIDDQPYSENAICVDSDFLEIFDFNYIYGDPLTALKEKENAIITDELARKYFKGENPIGKTITFDGSRQLTVSAVIKRLPQNTVFDFNIIANAGNLIDYESRNNWGNNGLMTFLLLSKNANLSDFNKKIDKNLITNRSNGLNNAVIEAQSIKDIHLYSAGKYVADYDNLGNIFYVDTFTIVAVLIFIIVCINFMNLSTARFSKRARECCIKKILGGGKKELIWNLLGESVVLSVAALIISLCLFCILMPAFESISGKHFAIVQFPGFFLVALLIAISLGITSGIYPALFMSSVDPTCILKGKFWMGKFNLRQTLIVFQFFVSISFITGALVVNNQTQFIKSRELGINKENILYLWMRDDFSRSFQTAKEELLKNPEILSVTRGSQLLTAISNSADGFNWEGKNPESRYLFHYESVDEDYQKTFDIKMKQGRFFSRNYNDSNSVVINEQAANIMKLREPLGSVLHAPGNQVYHVIGIVNDFHFKSLHHKIEPLLLLLTSGGGIAYIKTKSADMAKTVDYIKNVYNKFDSRNPFECNFLDKKYELLYNSENRMGKLFGYFSILAIFISCIGLFGVTVFTIQNRVKEIGVRKVNGAKISEIMAMLNKDLVKWVIISFMIAIPVSWYGAHKWLESFAYRIPLGWGLFTLAGLMALVIALLTVNWQCWRAANQNPVEALRYE